MQASAIVRAWRVFGRTFRLAYDHLGLTIGISFLWFVFVAAPLFVAYVTFSLTRLLGVWPVAFLVAVFTGAVAGAAVFALTFRLQKGEPVEMGDFFREARAYLRPATAIALVDLIISLILFLDLWVVWTAPNPTIRFFAWIWVYLGFIWALMLPLHLLLVVRQRDPRVWTVLRTSALIVAGNPVLSFLVLLEALLILFLNTLLAAGLILLLAGLMGLLYNLYLSEVVQAAKQRTSKDGSEPEGLVEGDRPARPEDEREGDRGDDRKPEPELNPEDEKSGA